MKKFQYLEAENLEDLLEILCEFKEDAKVNAGGTDLLSLFKDQYLFFYPKVLVNAKPVKELDYIQFLGGSLRIGALTKLSRIIEDPLVNEKFPVIRETVQTIGSPEIRNMGTVGGNLCQDIRCWYYRYPARLGGPLSCLRKGGKSCLAIRGDNRYHALIGKGCYAVCPSDLATTLSCLNAKLVILKKDGERKIAVEDLYTSQGLSLEPGEIVKEIEIPFNGDSRQKFIKFTLRRPIDFAIVSVASSFRFEGDVLKECAISLGGVSFKPERAKEVEDLLKFTRLNEKTADSVKEKILKDVKPLSKNGYKIPLVRALIKRVILSIM